LDLQKTLYKLFFLPSGAITFYGFHLPTIIEFGTPCSHALCFSVLRQCTSFSWKVVYFFVKRRRNWKLFI